jgi:hypothetical protein
MLQAGAYLIQKSGEETCRMPKIAASKPAIALWLQSTPLVAAVADLYWVVKHLTRIKPAWKGVQP